MTLYVLHLLIVAFPPILPLKLSLFLLLPSTIIPYLDIQNQETQIYYYIYVILINQIGMMISVSFGYTFVTKYIHCRIIILYYFLIKVLGSWSCTVLFLANFFILDDFIECWSIRVYSFKLAYCLNKRLKFFFLNETGIKIKQKIYHDQYIFWFYTG